jgi:hypothetical protein
VIIVIALQFCKLKQRDMIHKISWLTSLNGNVLKTTLRP